MRRSPVYAVASSWRTTGSPSRPCRRASSISCLAGSGLRPALRCSSRFPVTELVPVATRSWASSAVAMRQPSFRSPTIQSAGTRASSKKTSLNSATPVIWRSGRTVTPGWRIGITSMVMPRCLGTSGSVRASSTAKSVCCAPEVHTF